MPTSLHKALLGATLAATTLFILPGSAEATRGAGLRVVAPTGVLAEHTQYTGTSFIKSSPKADCFGPGNEGSGRRHRVRGATPLSAVKHALGARKALRPLLVTDAFADSFGLGLCGIGGFEGQSEPPFNFWYVKVNHKGVNSVEDRIPRGGEVVLSYTTGFDPELKLRAPARATEGVPFRVKVVEFNNGGNRSPAAGAMVNGFGPTAANGTVLVTGSGKRERLRATRDGSIPSNRAIVCLEEAGAAASGRCNRHAGERIFGTNRSDPIKTTRGNDRVRARRGADRINIRRGGRDRVNCGGGRDVVVKSRGDRNDRIADNCERVVNRR